MSQVLNFPGNASSVSRSSRLRSLKEIERDYILFVLKGVDWRQNRAVEILGISLKTLYRKIRKYDLKKPVFAKKKPSFKQTQLKLR